MVVITPQTSAEQSLVLTEYDPPASVPRPAPPADQLDHSGQSELPTLVTLFIHCDLFGLRGKKLYHLFELLAIILQTV